MASSLLDILSIIDAEISSSSSLLNCTHREDTNDLSSSVRVWISRAQDVFASASFANSANTSAPSPPSSSFVTTDHSRMTEAEALEAAAVNEKAKASILIIIAVVIVIIVIVVVVAVVVAVVIVGGGGVPPTRGRMVASSIGICGGNCGIDSGGAAPGEGGAGGGALFIIDFLG